MRRRKSADVDPTEAFAEHVDGAELGWSYSAATRSSVVLPLPLAPSTQPALARPDRNETSAIGQRSSPGARVTWSISSTGGEHALQVAHVKESDTRLVT